MYIYDVHFAVILVAFEYLPPHSNYTHERCVAFFADSKGNHFVLLQWYTEKGRFPSGQISLLPHLRMSDPLKTRSYDVLPIGCVVNGALMVPNGKDHWALMSPREHAAYDALNA